MRKKCALYTGKYGNTATESFSIYIFITTIYYYIIIILLLKSASLALKIGVDL